MNAHAADRYWFWWAVLAFGTFIVPEVYSLVVKKPEGTLSDTIWRLEDFDPQNGLSTWTAFHFLFIGILMVVFLWLIAHFGWRLFT